MAGLFKCPDFFYNSIPNEKICKDCEQSKMHIPEEDLEKTKELIERRGIKRLVHFTRRNNLASILKNGILPITELKNRQIGYYANDENRYDGFPCAISLSVTNPNIELWEKFSSRNFNWVKIYIDPALLYDSTTYRIYCATNAATTSAKKYNGSNIEHFEGMFQKEVTYKLEDGTQITVPRLKSTKANETTDDQAEILYFGRIDPKYFKD